MDLPRLTNFTPLRYPGGKGKIAPFIKRLLTSNGLEGGAYVEPYAGGAGIALELLLQEYVESIYLNDVSLPIWSFWQSVLEYPEELCKLVMDTSLQVATWDRQKEILKNAASCGVLELGFATFFLNRTNRSGILNGGIIGGRGQEGPWKIDARFNARELVRRIQSIARVADRIQLSCLDALQCLEIGMVVWPDKTLVYLDPPYYVKGRSLYLDCYAHDDHLEIARFLDENDLRQKWIVSYDNVPEIRAMYTAHSSIEYTLNYSARESRVGSEVMFFCESLKIPDLVRPMKAIAMSQDSR